CRTGRWAPWGRRWPTRAPPATRRRGSEMDPVVARVLIESAVKIAIFFFVTLTVVAYLTLVERRVSAWIQDRLGPNRVGPFGLLHGRLRHRPGGMVVEQQVLSDGRAALVRPADLVRAGDGAVDRRRPDDVRLPAPGRGGAAPDRPRLEPDLAAPRVPDLPDGGVRRDQPAALR